MDNPLGIPPTDYDSGSLDPSLLETNPAYSVDGMMGCMDYLSMLSNESGVNGFPMVNFSCRMPSFNMKDIPNPAEYDVLKNVEYQVTVVLLYIIVILLGGIGNTLVVLTVLKTKAMWNATNIFIANLALADVFVCVLDLPLTAYYLITDDWIFGKTLCYIIPMVFGIVVYSSTLTLTMISIDRYMLILFPLAKRMSVTIAMLLILCIIIMSIAVASPVAIYSKYTLWDEPDLGIHRSYCIEDWPSTELRSIYSVSTLILQYVLPLFIIAILYTRIFRRISRRMSTQSRNSRKTKTTKMLVAVVTVFAITWTPFHIHSMLLEFKCHPLDPRYYKFADALLRVLALSSSCINPLLYGWLNDNFRNAFLSIIKRPTATPVGINREDESEASRKTIIAYSPVQKLYQKLTSLSTSENRADPDDKRCSPSCCSSERDCEAQEAVPLQTVVVDQKGHGVVLKASQQNFPQILNCESNENLHNVQHNKQNGTLNNPNALTPLLDEK